MEKADLDSRADRIVGEWSGIFAPYEAFYIHSILYSADRVLEAFERYDLLRLEKAPGPDQVSAIHEALSHAASLSRFFWPSGGGPKKSVEQKALSNARAKKLREAFGLTGASTLKDRSLRDALEHFDERLDTYLLSSDAGQYAPLPRIGSAKGLPAPGIHIFKLVDPDALEFVILDRKFHFGSVREEASTILAKAREMSHAGDRLPRPAA